jgi:hypothetical protein
MIETVLRFELWVCGGVGLCTDDSLLLHPSSLPLSLYQSAYAQYPSVYQPLHRQGFGSPPRGARATGAKAGPASANGADAIFGHGSS